MVSLVARLLKRLINVKELAAALGLDLRLQGAKVCDQILIFGWLDGDLNVFVLEQIIFRELLLDGLKAVLGYRHIISGGCQLNAAFGFFIGIDLDTLFGHRFTSEGF
jgi:hypothetical protein